MRSAAPGRHGGQNERDPHESDYRIAYEDLGPEAIRRMEVENFVAVVVNDVRGTDLYEEGVKRYATSS